MCDIDAQTEKITEILVIVFYMRIQWKSLYLNNIFKKQNPRGYDPNPAYNSVACVLSLTLTRPQTSTTSNLNSPYDPGLADCSVRNHISSRECHGTNVLLMAET